jgi:hypothetical protein
MTFLFINANFTEHPYDGFGTRVQAFGFAWKLDHAAVYSDSHPDIQDDDDHHGTQEEKESTQLVHGPM